MVNYNAFYVDPLRHQAFNERKRNNALSFQQNAEQFEKRNDLAIKAQNSLEQYRNQRNILDQERIALQRKRDEAAKQQAADAKRIGALNSAYQIAAGIDDEEESNKAFQETFSFLAGEKMEDGMRVVKNGKETSVIVGDYKFTVPSKDYGGFAGAVKEANGNPQAIAQVISDFDAKVEPYKTETKSYTPNVKTFWDSDGKPHTIDVKKTLPQEGWSDTKPSDSKPEYTEKQAQDALWALDQYEDRLNTTGGVTEEFFAQIASENPEMAALFKGKDKKKIKERIAKRRRYLKKFIKNEEKNPQDPLGLGL